MLQVRKANDRAYVRCRQCTMDSLTMRAPTLAAMMRSALLSSAVLLHESQHRSTTLPSFIATNSSALPFSASISCSLLFHCTKHRSSSRTSTRCSSRRLWYRRRQCAHASLRNAASRRLRTVCIRVRMSARHAAFCRSCKCVCQRTNVVFWEYAWARASARAACSR